MRQDEWRRPHRLDGLPAGIIGLGATPRRRVAWACTCHPSPMPIEASQKGGVAPVNGRVPRSGNTVSGGHVATAREPATYVSAGTHMEMAFRCTCTPMSDVNPPISTHPRRSAFKIRLQGAVSCAVWLRPSIIVPALENRWRSFNSTIRLRQACRSPYSPSTRVTRLTDGPPGPGGLAAGRLVG